MPTVMDYDEVQVDFPKVIDYVAGMRGVITIMRYGKPLARISPIRRYRTTEPDPELAVKVNGDLFADESGDWESA